MTWRLANEPACVSCTIAAPPWLCTASHSSVSAARDASPSSSWLAKERPSAETAASACTADRP
jgi:hypothetical protein